MIYGFNILVIIVTFGGWWTTRDDIYAGVFGFAIGMLTLGAMTDFMLFRRTRLRQRNSDLLQEITSLREARWREQAHRETAS